MPPSQQPTQEQLQNMSPEEIAELQKKNCIFCKIIKGEIPGKPVYDDEYCFCLLDINPATEGHVLILPKTHYQIMPQIPEDVIGHMFKVAKAISQAQLKAFKAQGTTIMAANGVIAGQKAPHFMIHVFPRRQDDKIGMVLPKYKLTPQQLQELKQVLQPRINQEFGASQVPEQEEQENFAEPEEIPELPSQQNIDVSKIPEELFEPKTNQEDEGHESLGEEIEESEQKSEDELSEEDIELDKMKELFE